MKRLLYIFAVALAISACTNSNQTTICGVKLHGQTPWQLAAAIHDTGDQIFHQEEVVTYPQKAYIKGWYDTNRTDHPYTAEPYDDGLLPAEVVCDHSYRLLSAWFSPDLCKVEGRGRVAIAYCLPTPDFT